MYEYKRGFTLIEVILVTALMVIMFSLSLSLLSSFSNISKRNMTKDLDSLKSFLGQVKHMKLFRESNVEFECYEGRILLYLDNEKVDERKLICDQNLVFQIASTTYQLKINKHGYVLLQRI